MNREVPLTLAEKQKFEEWVKINVNDTIVPGDEGNMEALVYNLVHLIRGDGTRYDYKAEQDQEILEWGLLP